MTLSRTFGLFSAGSAFFIAAVAVAGEPKLPIAGPTKAEITELVANNRLDEAVEIVTELEANKRAALLRTFRSAGEVQTLFRIQERLFTADEPAVPKGKYLLRYKFAMGDVLRYRVVHATNVRSTVEGSTQTVRTQSESIKAWKVTDVLPSGEIEFIHLVESVKMSNETPGQPPRKYDSTADAAPPAGFEAAAESVGVPLVSIRITSTGKVTSREDKVARAAKPSEDMPITLELPADPVGIGAKWNHVYEIGVTKPGGGEMQIRTRRVCRLRQVRAGVAVIEVEYQILTPVDPFVRAQIVERLTKGAVRFDIERGCVVQQQHDVDRREVGFTGNAAASSMHFAARTQERLLPDQPAVARTPSEVQPASATE